jgi:hypothetical protein
VTNERSKHRVDVFLAADLGTQHAEADEQAPRERPDSPFRVLVIGDFSGRAHRMPTRESAPHSDLPLVWFNDTDRARVARLQSIASPNAPLSGRWSGSGLA